MIVWREGKAGFVGGQKFFMKGVFQFAYSDTSVDVAPTDGTRRQRQMPALIKSNRRRKC